MPAGAYHVAAQLLSIEAGVDLQPAATRVQLPAGRWLTLRADRVDGEVGIGGAAFAVTIEETSTVERVDLFARGFGLTNRKQELLEHLLEGPDTRTVAGLMFLSEHTVQDHLKSIFDKVGVRSRSCQGAFLDACTVVGHGRQLESFQRGQEGLDRRNHDVGSVSLDEVAAVSDDL